MYGPTNWTMHKQKSRIFAYFRTGYTELEELICTGYHIIWSYKLLFHRRVRWITHKQHLPNWPCLAKKKKNSLFPALSHKAKSILDQCFGATEFYLFLDWYPSWAYMNICKTRKGPDTGRHAKHTNGNNIKKRANWCKVRHTVPSAGNSPCHSAFGG